MWKFHENRGKIQGVMTSQVEVPPLTGQIHFISGKRRVNRKPDKKLKPKKLARIWRFGVVFDTKMQNHILYFFLVNPHLAVRDNSRTGGVCQLKSLSYLQYTTCNHSEQVFSYRSEPTFIQTRHFSLDSQVLDFTHTKKDREYQVSSCH